MYALHHACVAPLPDHQMERLVRGLFRLGTVTSETHSALSRRVAETNKTSQWPTIDGNDGMQKIFFIDSNPEWLVDPEEAAQQVANAPKLMQFAAIKRLMVLYALRKIAVGKQRNL